MTEGPEQNLQHAPVPRAPVFGKDYLRLHGTFRRFGPKNVAAKMDTWGQSAVVGVRELAGNIITLGDQMSPELWPTLFEEAKARGLGVCLKGYHRKLGCMIQNRQAYLDEMKRIAAIKPDMYYIFDELSFNHYSDAGAADFRDKTGYALARNTDINKLPDENTYQELRWRMDVMTALTRERVSIGKAASPNAVTFSVTAGGQMGFEFPAYNDVEAWSKSMGTTCTDLYTTDFNFERFSMQYMRGAQGNDRPVLSVHGNLNFAHENHVNLASQLMNGANGLWFFTFTYHTSARDRLGPIVDGYEMLRDTGLGERLAAARLMPYAAVLAERGTLFDGIRRGEFRGRRPFYHWRMEQQASLRNVPMDLVFASHLAKELPRYRILIVPSGRNMSHATASAITRWVRHGGTVIIEGEALLTPAMAALCGVQVSDQGRRQTLRVKPNTSLFPDILLSINTPVLPMQVKTARVLAHDTESPNTLVATQHKFGRGRAVALPLVDVPHQLLRPLVLELGGPLPAEVDPDSFVDVRLSVHTDGKRTTIGLFNEHFSQTKTVTVRLGNLPPTGKRLAINTSTGTHSRVLDHITVQLGPKDWNFILLDPAGSTAAPIEPGNPVSAATYAPVTGFDFLKLKRKQTANPITKDPGTLAVAIFRSDRNHQLPCDHGAQAIMGKLIKQEKVSPRWIDQITPGALKGFDVLIIPNMADRAANLAADWQQHVRHFVADGGGALLIHHSAGHPALGGAPFSKIGSLGTFTSVRGMKVVADHPITTASASAVEQAFAENLTNPAFMAQLARTKLMTDTNFISGFPDYMPIKPGGAGITVIRSMVDKGVGGDATLVAGTVGLGRTVLAGISIGAKCVRVDEQYITTEQLTPEEEAILINSVFWLGQ